MYGCIRASVTEIRLCGSRFRHFSSKSINNACSSISSALAPDGSGPIRSRIVFTGLVIVIVLTIPFCDILSISCWRKLERWSKWVDVNCPLRSIFFGNFPKTSIITLNMPLFDRPGNNIFPVASSKRVQPTDHMSIAVSYVIPRTTRLNKSSY